MTVFFKDKKETFKTLEGAMAWLDVQAARFGMTKTEAEQKGYAQIFNV